ncbi:CIA30 family protein [Marinicella marina]|nr:CIA30 family protein [Marinicella marina]
MTNNSDTPALQVFKFNQLQDNQHMIVNDSVMGGRSDSEMAMQNDAALYTGKVSLENNGGFASVRMIWPFELADTKDQPKVVRLNVKGDGKSYQLRLRTNRGFDGAAYSYQFDTIKDQQQTIYIPVDQFIPTFRGRVLRDMPKLKFSDVRQMGVLIADYQTGDFAIELHYITLQ